MVSPRKVADRECEQYLLKIRNRMSRVNKQVACMEKPIQKSKPARLTKANLEQLKDQLQESLAAVQPKYGRDALDFQELVSGFQDRIYTMAEEKAWR